MFTIDFLKEQGLPDKSRPIKTGVITIIASVLLVGFCLLGIQYFKNKIVLASKQKELVKSEAMLLNNSGGKNRQSQTKRDLGVYVQCKNEIAASIGRYTQWTPILREFSVKMPASLLLDELSVIRTIKKKKINSILDPKKKVDYEIIHRTIKSNVCDFAPQDEGAAVEKYLDKLRGSTSLKGILGKTYIAESNDGEFEDEVGKKFPVKNYVINCLLKADALAESE